MEEEAERMEEPEDGEEAGETLPSEPSIAIILIGSQ